MSYVAIIKLLLSLANMFMKRLSDAQQQQIGADRVVKDNLVDLIQVTNIAKEVDVASDYYTDDDIDNILQDHYRD